MDKDTYSMPPFFLHRFQHQIQKRKRRKRKIKSQHHTLNMKLQEKQLETKNLMFNQTHQIKIQRLQQTMKMLHLIKNANFLNLNYIPLQKMSMLNMWNLMTMKQLMELLEVQLNQFLNILILLNKKTGT